MAPLETSWSELSADLLESTTEVSRRATIQTAKGYGVYA